MIPSDWELWAVAQKVLNTHKARAKLFVADRIASLSEAGDEDGVATWQLVAARIDQLADFGSAHPRKPH